MQMSSLNEGFIWGLSNVYVVSCLNIRQHSQYLMISLTYPALKSTPHALDFNRRDHVSTPTSLPYHAKKLLSKEVEDLPKERTWVLPGVVHFILSSQGLPRSVRKKNDRTPECGL